MPVWESEKGLERKLLFRSLQSTPTGGWVSLLQSFPCHEPKNIRILNLNIAKKLDQRDMGEPFGNDSTCLRYAASAKAGANLKTSGHSRI